MTRGGHPEQHEAGGAWGDPGRPSGPGPRRPQGARIPGPRREFVDAFDGSRTPVAADLYASVTTWPDEPSGGTAAPARGAPAVPAPRPGGGTGAGGGAGASGDGDGGGGGRGGRAGRSGGGGKGRTFTGIAAAAVTTVLAVVVAGQVAEENTGGPGTSTTGPDRTDEDSSSRSENRSAPSEKRPALSGGAPTAQPPTYAEQMARQFSIEPESTAKGDFEAVPGFDRAPGNGRKIRYRVDIEKGLEMDGRLFAQAIQRTLNDSRSWAHNGVRTFERISSGEPEFVVTLASPGTTDKWCAKSGLNTSIDKVSCDSASTDRVMINAFRWGQGSDTYGPEAMHAYRQMLINHEVGHRLGHGHVNCGTPGALAPVMQQQTKSLNIGGVKCRPNPWPNPGS
ncbi:DUF3152 domain-containing protein [Streptomyces sp. NPDC001985]|uniref:DUF3152 domain-containing protein n=1 Tax=Streptomyces sp. NPDC001985 TaxID=3154406 RepID=UPI003323909A